MLLIAVDWCLLDKVSIGNSVSYADHEIWELIKRNFEAGIY